MVCHNQLLRCSVRPRGSSKVFIPGYNSYTLRQGKNKTYEFIMSHIVVQQMEKRWNERTRTLASFLTSACCSMKRVWTSGLLPLDSHKWLDRDPTYLKSETYGKKGFLRLIWSFNKLTRCTACNPSPKSSVFSIHEQPRIWKKALFLRSKTDVSVHVRPEWREISAFSS